MEPFGDNAKFFISAQDLLRMLFRPGRKHVIFRYQNSSPRLTTDLAYTLVILILTTVRKLIRTEIYWIMHNIDRETTDKFPILTKLRRTSLKWASKYVFVTDPLFKERFFSADKKVKSISFGPKFDGTVGQDTLDAIIELGKQHDLVALCLGASGDKYVHFCRLDKLSALAAKHKKTLLLILPEHAVYKGDNAIRIKEKNIDEKAMAPYVDFVYRINDDISMPYTIYAACDAAIPVVTGRDFFTYEIIEKYEIGFSEEDIFLASEAQMAFAKLKMREFMQDRTWHSLADALAP